jgi:6-phosphofructokinase 1
MKETLVKRIGVLTSGGDAPGMNAAIRAVVRRAIYNSLEVIGIRRGYSGLICGDVEPLIISSVADIVQRGGTFLRTARSEEFYTAPGRRRAWETINNNNIEGLVVIGGDGTFRGARELAAEYPVGVIGVPATIDNDIAGTDFAVGFDTAINNVVEAVNKIRDTATSVERIVVVEVMGHATGFIALEAGLAGGAESILIPEVPFSIEDVCEKIRLTYKRGKLHSIIIVAEGAASGLKIGEQIKNGTGLDTRVTILGHIQRGGSPTAFDRNLASKMGSRAVELLAAGCTRKMIAMESGKITAVNLDDIIGQKKSIDLESYQLANILSF